MKLSIVILCWNDRKVIGDCLQSIYEGTHATDLEIIVPVNGSSDGSVEFIRQNYPAVRVIENGANLGFSKGNNVGIRVSRGDFVLILNPDTIIPDGALDRWVEYAEQHPKAGAFGCRLLNLDGTFQGIPRPFPTPRGSWIAALSLRRLAHISKWFASDTYVGWDGDTERIVDWVCGACLMVRDKPLHEVGGFDEQFVYHYEEMDLCRRIWRAGYSILYTPEVKVTHLGGQSTKDFPLPFELERCRNGYRYFYKYYGERGARSFRRAQLVHLNIRRLAYGFLQRVRPSETRRKRLEILRILNKWFWQVDPVRLVQKGEEPDFGVKKTYELA